MICNHKYYSNRTRALTEDEVLQAGVPGPLTLFIVECCYCGGKHYYILDQEGECWYESLYDSPKLGEKKDPYLYRKLFYGDVLEEIEALTVIRKEKWQAQKNPCLEIDGQC